MEKQSCFSKSKIVWNKDDIEDNIAERLVKGLGRLRKTPHV